MLSLIKEFYLFLVTEAKWWLVPVVLVLLGVAAIVIFAQSSAIAPFIYPLF